MTWQLGAPNIETAQFSLHKTMCNDPNIIIDRLGGTSETAKMFDIEPASVSGWRTNGIPKSRLMYIKLARPDVIVSEDEALEIAAHPAPEQEAA